MMMLILSMARVYASVVVLEMRTKMLVAKSVASDKKTCGLSVGAT